MKVTVGESEFRVEFRHRGMLMKNRRTSCRVLLRIADDEATGECAGVVKRGKTKWRVVGEGRSKLHEDDAKAKAYDVAVGRRIALRRAIGGEQRSHTEHIPVPVNARGLMGTCMVSRRVVDGIDENPVFDRTARAAIWSAYMAMTRDFAAAPLPRDIVAAIRAECTIEVLTECALLTCSWCRGSGGGYEKEPTPAADMPGEYVHLVLAGMNDRVACQASAIYRRRESWRRFVGGNAPTQ